MSEAIAIFLGTIIGGSISLFTTWLTQRYQMKRDEENHRREQEDRNLERQHNIELIRLDNAEEWALALASRLEEITVKAIDLSHVKNRRDYLHKWFSDEEFEPQYFHFKTMVIYRINDDELSKTFDVLSQFWNKVLLSSKPNSSPNVYDLIVKEFPGISGELAKFVTRIDELKKELYR